jgi:hypothetical protein
MSLFATNWRTQIERLLPPFKRSVSVLDFLESLLVGLATAGSTWDAFDIEIRKRARFNGQKIVLQAALNDIFSVSGIIIETQTSLIQKVFTYNEAEVIPPIYSFNESESIPTIYTFNESEIPDDFDFIVLVPVGIHTAELERRIREEVKTYKLAGKLFDYQTY